MEPKPNQPNKWLLLSTMGIEMFVFIYGGHRLGLFLNKRFFDHAADYHKIFIMVGIVIAFYSVFRKLKDLNAP